MRTQMKPWIASALLHSPERTQGRMRPRKPQLGGRYLAWVRGAFRRAPRPVVKPLWQTMAKADGTQ